MKRIFNRVKYFFKDNKYLFIKILELLVLGIILFCFYLLSKYFYSIRLFPMSRIVVIWGVIIATLGISFIVREDLKDIEISEFLNRTIDYGKNNKTNFKKIKRTIPKRLSKTVEQLFESENSIEKILYFNFCIPVIILEITYRMQPADLAENYFESFSHLFLLAWKVFYTFVKYETIIWRPLILLSVLIILYKFSINKIKYGLFALAVICFGMISVFLPSMIISLPAIILSTEDKSQDIISLFYPLLIFLIGMIFKSFIYIFKDLKKWVRYCLVFALPVLSAIPLFEVKDASGGYNYHYIDKSFINNAQKGDFISNKEVFNIEQSGNSLEVKFQSISNGKVERYLYKFKRIKEHDFKDSLNAQAIESKVNESGIKLYLLTESKENQILIYYPKYHAINLYNLDITKKEDVEELNKKISEYQTSDVNKIYEDIQFVQSKSKEYTDIFYESTRVDNDTLKLPFKFD